MRRFAACPSVPEVPYITKNYLDDALVCTFDTGLEWKQGPYSKEKSCSSCHMPSIERAIAVGGPRRASRRHLFFGSKIPKKLPLTDAERADYALYQPGLAASIVSTKPAAKSLIIELKLKNARAGHMLPTGDPERFIRVDVKLLANGKVVETKSLRIGQSWEWWPKARKLADNRLKPLEERIEKLEFPAVRPATVRVEVYNCRLSEQNASYHNLTGRYPLEAKVLELEPYRVP